MKKKIAIINQRYGTEVNGGSEYYTKKLAEHLKEYYDIEVLTTTALNYDKWKPYYPAGVMDENGVKVHRFQVEKIRNIILFKVINKMVQLFPNLNKLLEPMWIKLQGPYCPQLIEYIKKNKDHFDTFIFVTYLYYTTAVGLPEVAKKAILVPTAHDEYCIYFSVYEEIFKSPKGIIYLTEEERKFAEQLFENHNVPNIIAGSGIDIPEKVDCEDFRKKYGINTNYIIYVGRVDTSKKCDELFMYFTKYNNQYQKDLKLIVVGKMMMEKPVDEQIICLGFLSEKEKGSAIAGARALIMPSEHESLSLAVLEALASGVPVVVNGACSVLAGHCEKSGAGFTYKTYEQFADDIEVLYQDEMKYKKMSIAGKQYVSEYYNWDNTIGKYRKLIEL
ncbi:glycosyltransferase family 4 protein [Clostridium sp. HBUAS56010]|uniref:glycosyltransferase family 4 protein n=1 Tax=Clostridium sp. HBUAS56010 TaxID=2571127 RepID=UPI00163DC4EE|nr:glycosyltransferase family 4 protein [Clostridium sp. HBUAS56010]